jgi:ATP-dependent DNA helicase
MRPFPFVQVISKLHLILRPFLLRRLKEDVEKSLPRKKEIILYAPMSSRQKEFHNSLLNGTLAKYLEENQSPGMYHPLIISFYVYQIIVDTCWSRKE